MPTCSASGGSAAVPNAAAREAVAAAPYLCGRRNFDTLPQGVRDFFMHFLAAKFSGVDFETFKEEMEDREATAAFFAWREAAKKGGRR